MTSPRRAVITGIAEFCLPKGHQVYGITLRSASQNSKNIELPKTIKVIRQLLRAQADKGLGISFISKPLLVLDGHRSQR